MSLMFRIYLNNAYIGTMRESFAHTIAAVLCIKVGDILTLEEEYDDYGWGNVNATHTYYHNGDELLCFSHTEHQFPTFTSEEEIQQKVRTKTYTNRLTGFKYNREDARGRSGARRNISYMKRDINRAARRVGKELTREQIAA